MKFINFSGNLQKKLSKKNEMNFYEWNEFRMKLDDK